MANVSPKRRRRKVAAKKQQSEMQLPEPELAEESQSAPMNNETVWLSQIQLEMLYGKPYNKVNYNAMKKAEPDCFRNGKTTEELLYRFWSRNPNWKR